ncbi:MAG: septal ring lytic transglycosylase RlpA family protein [Calditrichaeota bacterium]|nr:MAG: septal ring lytic transglycosylase RlpA family protein [Calditrichota bacterium]
MRLHGCYLRVSFYVFFLPFILLSCITPVPREGYYEYVDDDSEPVYEDVAEESDEWYEVNEAATVLNEFAWTGEAEEVYYGKASYYGFEFEGRPTASGEIFDPLKLTAAHRWLPFGTMCRVTNVSNGRSVVVRINDRGPFIEGRILDLSYQAAKVLGAIRPGVIEVKIEILKKGK